MAICVVVGCVCSNKSEVLDCKFTGHVPSVHREYWPFQEQLRLLLSGGIQVVTAYFLAVSLAGQGRLLERSPWLLEWLHRLNNSIFGDLFLF